MIWLVPIVVLLLTIFFARQAVHANTNRSSTVKHSLNHSHTNSPIQSHNESKQYSARPHHTPSQMTKNDVKPHEAPSLLFAKNAAVTDDDEDGWDEVEDIGDITMDISEMLKELNLRETDSPRLEIDTSEYSQLKTGQPGEMQPQKIVNVAGKLRKMLY